MTLFGRLDRSAQAVHERVFGEAFLWRPRTRKTRDVNAPAIFDTSRLELQVVGIYREKDADQNVVDAWDQRTDRRPGVSAHTHVIEVDPRTNAGFDAKIDDLLERLSDGSAWRIVSIDPDTEGRCLHNVEKVG